MMEPTNEHHGREREIKMSTLAYERSLAACVEAFDQATHSGASIAKVAPEHLGKIIAAAKSAEPFQFHAAPNSFLSTDSGCTEAVICDADVQMVRKAHGWESE